MEIKNALITDTFLGYEDHGIFTFWINVDIGSGGGSVGIGGFSLDEYDHDKKRRVFRGSSLEAIARVMHVVGVESWEELKGKYIRVKDEGWGGTVDEIGNLMEDQWFNIRKYFVDLAEAPTISEEQN